MKSKMRPGGILLLTLLLAMVFSIGSVYAQDEYVPIPGPDNQIKIAKTLDLKGSTSGPEHVVTFKTQFVNSTPTGLAPEGTVDDVTLTFGGSINLADEYIDFSKVKFSKPGTYFFRVTETIPSGLSIRAKSGTETTYTIQIHVENDVDTSGHSGLTIDDIQYIKGSNNAKSNSLLFQNEWDNYRIQVKKEVTGNQGDKTRTFNVRVPLTPFTSGMSVTVRWISGTPAVTAVSNKVTAANPVTVNGSGTGTTARYVELFLKDGDQVLIEGLTANQRVQIVENSGGEYSYGDYTVSINGNNTYYTEQQSAPDVNDRLFTVVNNKEGTAPTGLFINNWPYIAVIIIALVGSIVFIRRRKARYDYEADL